MRLVALLAVLACAATSAQARTATGYVGGEKTQLKLTDVDGKDVEVRTAKAFRRMAKAARKDGVKLAIRSGFRSFEKQAKLYKKYRKGEGNLAAPPGYSNHESGRALDIYITDHDALAWLQKHGARYGFHRTVPGEAWHWEYLGDEEREIARATKRHDRKRHGAPERAKAEDRSTAPAPAPSATPAPAPSAAPDPMPDEDPPATTALGD